MYIPLLTRNLKQNLEPAALFQFHVIPPQKKNHSSFRVSEQLMNIPVWFWRLLYMNFSVSVQRDCAWFWGELLPATRIIMNAASRWNSDSLRCVMWRVSFIWAYKTIRGCFSLLQPVCLCSVQSCLIYFVSTYFGFYCKKYQLRLCHIILKYVKEMKAASRLSVFVTRSS
jgi:hypothetical protein